MPSRSISGTANLSNWDPVSGYGNFCDGSGVKMDDVIAVLDGRENQFRPVE
ncbi:hypothetical protein [Methylocystis iwaonis]|uniref:hypothetical protein n=1 Tax=Methylocystis iwaonis TaxID=2885079 RepID=UPI002E7B79EB|nr:hypothetical protein [Methylocystis iwaonis]